MIVNVNCIECKRNHPTNIINREAVERQILAEIVNNIYAVCSTPPNIISALCETYT